MKNNFFYYWQKSTFRITAYFYPGHYLAILTSAKSSHLQPNVSLYFSFCDNTYTPSTSNSYTPSLCPLLDSSEILDKFGSTKKTLNVLFSSWFRQLISFMVNSFITLPQPWEKATQAFKTFSRSTTMVFLVFFLLKLIFM